MSLDNEPVRFDEIDSLPPALAATLRQIGPSRTAYKTAIEIADRYGVKAAIKVFDEIIDNRPDKAQIVLSGCSNPYQVAIHQNGCQPGKINLVPKGGRMQ